MARGCRLCGAQSRLETLFIVNESCELFCESLLSRVWNIILLFHLLLNTEDFIHLHKGEHAHELDHIGIRNAVEILIEVIRRTSVSSEPDRSAFSLAEFFPITSCQ